MHPHLSPASKNTIKNTPKCIREFIEGGEHRARRASGLLFRIAPVAPAGAPVRMRVRAGQDEVQAAKRHQRNLPG